MIRFICWSLLPLIAMVFGPSPAVAQPPFIWNLNANGDWDSATANWLQNNVPTTYTSAAGSIATFANVISADRSINLPAGITAGTVNFETVNNFRYTIGGAGILTLNGTAGTDTVNVRPFTSSVSSAGNGVGQTLFTNDLLVNNQGIFSSASGSTIAPTLVFTNTVNRVAAGGSITVQGHGTTQFTGAIGSNVTGGLVKNGSGLLLLAGANNFSGNVRVNDGVLSVNTDGGFGTGANQVILGASNNGAIRFGSGFSTGRTFDMQGDGRWVLNGASTLVLTGTNFTGSAGRRLTVLNDGSLNSSAVLEIQGANSFAGDLVLGDKFQLAGPQVAAARVGGTSVPAPGVSLRLSGTAGTLAGANSVTVNPNASLILLQPGGGTASLSNRLGSTPITFNSGRFQYGYSANVTAVGAVTENPGALTLTGNSLFMGLTDGSVLRQVGTVSAANLRAGPTAGISVNFGTLTRTDLATAMFKLTTTGNGQIGGTPSASTINYFMGGVTDPGGAATSRQIIPWASFAIMTSGAADDPQGFMTYDANGFRALTVNESSLPTVGTFAAESGTNVRLSGGSTFTTNAGGQTLNSLYSASGTNTVQGGGTLTIAGTGGRAGAIGSFGGLILSNLNVSLPNGGYIHAGGTFSVTGTTSIAGSSGLAIAGFNNSTTGPVVQFNNSAANPFTGGLFLQGNAQVSFTNNNQLGDPAGEVVLQGGALYSSVAGTVTMSTGGTDRAIRIGASNGFIGGTTSSSVVVIPGLISGSGQLVIGGPRSSAGSVVSFTNASANTYTGGTVINRILAITNENQLGTGVVSMFGSLEGILRTNSSMTLSKTYELLADGGIDTSGNNVTFNGVLRGVPANPALFSSYNLRKNGTGTLTIVTDNPELGTAVQINEGTLALGNGGTTGSLGTGAIAIGILGTLRVDRSNEITLGSTISGNGVLHKNGAGTLILTAANSYAGGTTVTSGTLLAMNRAGTSATGAGPVVVNGGTIGGTGAISGPLTLNGGALAPGASPGIFTVNGNVTFTAASSFVVELNGNTAGNAANNHDRLVVNGAVTLGNAQLLASVGGGYVPASGDLLFILTNDAADPISGTFFNLPNLGTVNLGSYFATISYFGDAGAGTTTGGNDVVLFNITVVPEPTTLGLTGMAGAGLVWWYRRRRLNVQLAVAENIS